MFRSRILPAGVGTVDAAHASKRLAMELPADIEAAAAVLREHGHDFDPRLIDIYQLGTLACRLLTGGSIREYMYTLDARGRLPGDLALLLDRMLGHSGDDRIETIDELLELLSDAKIEEIEKGVAQHASRYSNTPPDGSIMGRDGDTPPRGSASQSIDEIPFEQLGPSASSSSSAAAAWATSIWPMTIRSTAGLPSRCSRPRWPETRV